MYIVIARYRARPETAETVAYLLPELAAASRAEPGNVSYSIARDLDDSTAFVIVEAYGEAKDFDAHRRSAHFQDLGVSRIIPLLDDRHVEKFHADPD